MSNCIYLNNVLVIGGLIFDEDRQLVCGSCKNSLPNFASDEHLRAFLSGLSGNGLDYSLINATAIGNYPQTSTLRKFCPKFQHPNDRTTNISFSNVFGFKQLSIKRQVHKLVKQWIKNHPEGGSIFVYGLYSPFVLGLPKINHQLFKIITIIPDIPVYFNSNGRSPFYKHLKILEFRSMKKRLLDFDANITLTKYMAAEIGLSNDLCYVIEGFGPSVTKYQATQAIPGSVVYTGKLDKEFGIRNLLAAFDRVNFPTKHLYLYGNGNDSKFLTEHTRGRSDVTMGMVTSKDTLSLIQRSAYVLVNPRSSKNAFTKFSFPSKTMEYLASGRPVLMSHLEGVPSEYDDYLFYCNVDNVDDFASNIEKMLNKTPNELLALSDKELAFVREKKNSKFLVKGFLDFFNTKYEKN